MLMDVDVDAHGWITNVFTLGSWCFIVITSETSG